MYIETKRLIIRYFEEKDVEDVYEYLSKQEVVQFEPYQPFTYEKAKEETLRRIKDRNFYAVTLTSGKLIGNLYLSKGDFDTYEVGYVFNSKYWKKGYARESLKALVDYTFSNHDAHRIMAMCNPDNSPSWKLLESLDFRREAHLHKNIYFFKDENHKPIWLDTYVYAILKEDWLKTKK